MGLRLNLDEAVDFLRLAGYALSPISQTDKIVEYFIRKEEYGVISGMRAAMDLCLQQ